MSEILNGPAGRIARLRTLMAERGYDAVVVRDEANLRWLTGAMRVFDYTGEYPHVAFVTADECFLHTDSRYFNSFEENMPAGSPWKLDMDEIDMPRWVAEHARSTRSRVVAVEDDMHINFFRGIERGLEDCSICASLPLMHGDLQLMRAVKDAEEIELMRHAQSITDAAFAHMCEFIRPGLTEKQLRTELETFMFDHGADDLAFGSIVASGPNTANPHAISSDRVVEKGDFVLMDYGAGYRDYKSDMTRTVCVGEPSEKQREIYDIVRMRSASPRFTPAWTATTFTCSPRRSSVTRATASTTATALAMAWASTSTSCRSSAARATSWRRARSSPLSPASTCPAWAACVWRTTAWSPRTGTSPSRPLRTSWSSSTARSFCEYNS